MSVTRFHGRDRTPFGRWHIALAIFSDITAGFESLYHRVRFFCLASLSRLEVEHAWEFGIVTGGVYLDWSLSRLTTAKQKNQ